MLLQDRWLSVARPEQTLTAIPLLPHAGVSSTEHASDAPPGKVADHCQARANIGIIRIQRLRCEASLAGAQVERQMVWGGCAAMVIRGKVLMEPLVAQVLVCPETHLKATVLALEPAETHGRPWTWH